MIGAISIFFSAAVVSLLLTFPLLWLLSLLRAGQPVRAEGPSSHLAKSGTLTMGGIAFVATILILSLIQLDLEINLPYALLLLLVFSFALIGLADDLLKVRRGQNLGLTFWQKIVWQSVAAFVFAIEIFLYGKSLMPVWYYLFALPFFIFVIIGSANATNLTDGLNGLLAGCAVLAYLAFAVVAQKAGDQSGTIFALIAAGAVFPFLYFNFLRAKLFMGDAGSLALGAGLAGLSIILKKEWLLAVIGAVFVLEALSVIIQVGWYKLFKRRLLLMSPLHHHFELLGMKESKVVMLFWVSAAVFALLGIYLLK